MLAEREIDRVLAPKKKALGATSALISADENQGGPSSVASPISLYAHLHFVLNDGVKLYT